jgi:hypothetical protein
MSGTPPTYNGANNGGRKLLIPAKTKDPAIDRNFGRVANVVNNLLPPNPITGQVLTATGESPDETGLEWATPAAGSITEITSTDGSITVTNPFGPVTDLSAPGATGMRVRLGMVSIQQFSWVHTNFGAGPPYSQNPSFGSQPGINVEQNNTFLTSWDTSTNGHLKWAISGTSPHMAWVLCTVRLHLRSSAATVGAPSTLWYAVSFTGSANSSTDDVLVTVPTAVAGTGFPLAVGASSVSAMSSFGGSGFDLRVVIHSTDNSLDGDIVGWITAWGIGTEPP